MTIIIILGFYLRIKCCETGSNLKLRLHSLSPRNYSIYYIPTYEQYLVSTYKINLHYMISYSSTWIKKQNKHWMNYSYFNDNVNFQTLLDWRWPEFDHFQIYKIKNVPIFTSDDSIAIWAFLVWKHDYQRKSYPRIRKFFGTKSMYLYMLTFLQFL